VIDESSFEGIWIPAAIWNRSDISWFHKCLCGLLDSLNCGDPRNDPKLLKHLAWRMHTEETWIRSGCRKLAKVGLLERKKTEDAA
jgi:hypothetical protein